MPCAANDSDRSLDKRLPAELAGLRRFLARLCGNHDVVDDLIQETVTRSLRYQGSFRADFAFGPWLRGIAMRCFLDHRREQQRLKPTDGLDCNQWPDPRVSQGDEQLDLERALMQLNDRERDVLLRFHRDGESIQEISESLETSVGTIKSQLHRGRRKLAQYDSARRER